MMPLKINLARGWMRLGAHYLPFADAATEELPLERLLRLSLFQISVGMAVVLLNGTLNRVMIVELGVPSWLVACMVSLPLIFAPLRAMIGFRSDNHFSALGWKRVPYIWFGTMLQFGGLAIMPFALIVLSGDADGPAWIGNAAAALAFPSWAPGCTRPRRPGWRWRPTLRPSKRGRAWSHFFTSCCCLAWWPAPLRSASFWPIFTSSASSRSSRARRS